MIEKLASLSPVHGALDQIVQRFGTDMVAEVTGRSRRIIRKTGSDRIDRLVVENRAGSANLAETQAMMFHNRAHGGLNMVYRRNDGNIGWVDPALKPVSEAAATAPTRR